MVGIDLLSFQKHLSYPLIPVINHPPESCLARLCVYMVRINVCSICELRHDLFYVDNTRQVRGVLLGQAKREVVGKVLEQIGRSSGSHSI